MYYTNFQLKDISTYRSEIMGWSILWIMMLHFDFKQITPLGFIGQYGLAGVDAFLFVSGFGIFHSLEKTKSIWNFYMKRCVRIFPVFCFIGMFGSILLFHDSFLTYIYRHTTLGYWFGGVSFPDWYIASLLLLYLFSPLFKHLIDHSVILVYFIIIFFIVAAFYVIDKDYIIDRPHFCFFHRIPDYLFGMICAYWLKNKKANSYFYLVLLIGIPLFILFFPHHHQISNYKNYSLMFLMPTFIVCFITISKIIRGPITTIVTRMGDASLEIYLIQGLFAYAFSYKIIPVPDSWHDSMTIFLIILCSFLGCTLHWGVEKTNLYDKIGKATYAFISIFKSH